MLYRLYSSSRISGPMTARILARIPPERLAAVGARRALRLFRTAAKSVPAYRDFLEAHGIRPEDIRTIGDFESRLPATDKGGYVNRYTLAARCLHGRFPADGLVEESSGSFCGRPTNWVRSAREEKPYVSLMKTILGYLYPVEKGEELIILNGFALGAWAGGLAFSRRAGPWGLIKNIGPDAGKIIRTMLDLGTGGTYLVSGYPPFLRRLAEAGLKTPGFDWKEYRVHLYSGGEGFAEGWREYMAAQLREGARIFSTYGAIDLEAGIAMETPVTIAIRRLLDSDPATRRELLGTERSPCFFGTYSPMNFHISEAVGPAGAKELVVTVLNSGAATPKIKYNIGDEGGVIPFRRMADVLKRREQDILKMASSPGGSVVVPFPFLYVLGRSDGTVSIEGSNIRVSDVHEAIFSDPELASKVGTFKLAVETEPDASLRLYVYVEAREGVAIEEAWKARCAEVVVSRILASNECFRRSCLENPETTAPRVIFLLFRAGVFTKEETLLKHNYMKR